MDSEDRRVSERAAGKPLRLGLLTMDRGNYSSQRLVAAAIARGHSIEVLETLKCHFEINDMASAVQYDGKVMPDFDAVIPRIGTGLTAYGASVVRCFSQAGVYCINSSEAILASRDKMLAHELLSRHGFPLPRTIFACSGKDAGALVDEVGGPPLVIKMAQGSQGGGIALAETYDAAISAVQSFVDLEVNFLVQEYIAEAGNCDVRCLVIGNQIIASMMRRATRDEFRSNLHKGGSAIQIEISSEERDLALKATRLFGMEVAGVDILRSKRGSLLLELNSSPGLRGIESVSNTDIADAIITHIEGRLSGSP